MLLPENHHFCSFCITLAIFRHLFCTWMPPASSSPSPVGSAHLLLEFPVGVGWPLTRKSRDTKVIRMPPLLPSSPCSTHHYLFTTYVITTTMFINITFNWLNVSSSSLVCSSCSPASVSCLISPAARLWSQVGLWWWPKMENMPFYENGQNLISSSENFQLLLCFRCSLCLLGHVASVHVQPLFKGLYAVLLGSQVCPDIIIVELEKKKDGPIIGYLVYRCCPGRKSTCARHSSHTYNAQKSKFCCGCLN